VQTKGHSSTQSLSGLKNLLATKVLIEAGGRGHGLTAMERLFGATGSGRILLARVGARLDKRGADHDPLQDSCVPAVVRPGRREATKGCALSWCKNSKTLFHCSTRNTSALVLIHLWNSWSQRLFYTLSDVAHTDARLFAVAAVFAAACS
jgi:hypothetical protein